MEISDTIAGILVVLALVIAIYSTMLRNSLNDFFEAIGMGDPIIYWLPGDILLLIIEVGLLIIIIVTAIYGQRISRT